MSKSRSQEGEWTKVDLHIHTLDDPKDIIDYSAQDLLARARDLGFGVLAITLHDAVFDRPEVFQEARELGILLIPAAEMRIEGADIILLNISKEEAADLKTFADVRALRTRRGDSLFTIAPHPFYVLGGSIGSRLFAQQDCFDAIELCHFHKGPFNPNRRAARVARRFGKPLIATSDAHRLHAFGRHYTRIRRPPQALTCESFFAILRAGPLALTSPPCTTKDLMNAIYFIFLSHPARLRRQKRRRRSTSPEDESVPRADLNSPGKRDTATPDENPRCCSAAAGHRADGVQVHLESR